MEIYDILIYAAIASIVIAFCIGLVYYREFDANLKRGFLIIALALLTEGSVQLLSPFIKSNTNWVYYFAGPMEYISVAWFLSFLIESKAVKKVIKISLVLSIILAVLNAIFLQHPPRGATNFTIFKGAFLALWSLFYVRGLLQYSPKLQKLNYPEFIICMGIMFYYSFSVVFWSIYRYLTIKDTRQSLVFLKIFPMLAISNIVMYIAFAIGFAMFKKHQGAKQI